jgi:hypothetical protein
MSFKAAREKISLMVIFKVLLYNDAEWFGIIVVNNC